MSTPDERVEVTPELLTDLETKAKAGPWLSNGAFDGHRGSAPPAVVLALVQRIRELESDVEGLENEVRDLEQRLEFA